jgi:NTP pyrophosphatase (non-canonical NTP hydrolase)
MTKKDLKTISGKSLDEITEVIGSWGDEAFPASSINSILKHMVSEAAELIQALMSGSLNDSEGEMVDIFHLMCQYFHRANGSTFEQAVQHKFDINQLRKWGPPNQAGFQEHVKNPVQPALLGVHQHDPLGVVNRPIVINRERPRYSEEAAKELAAALPFHWTLVYMNGMHLLDCGVPIDELHDVLGNLAALASFTNQSLATMVWMYAEMVERGYLTRDDVQSLSEYGVNLVPRLANMNHSSESDIESLIDDESVNAPAVMQAIKRMGLFQEGDHAE